MTVPTTPAEVVRAVPTGVSRLVAGGLDEAARDAQLDRLAALYAEHTDVRHPFAPLADDAPLTTRVELRRHFAGSLGRARGVERFEPVGTHVHGTDDPEVVIMEFRYEGSVDGRPFSLPCVFVMRVRDAEIVESRDYGDGVAFARAFGRLGELADALTSEPSGAAAG